MKVEKDIRRMTLNGKLILLCDADVEKRSGL
jgi:hypothetical protein